MDACFWIKAQQRCAWQKKKRSIHWWWLWLPKLCNHSIRVLLTTLSHLEGQMKLKALPALQQPSPPELGGRCWKVVLKVLVGSDLACKFGFRNSGGSEWNFKKVTTIMHPVYDNKDCLTAQGQVTYPVRQVTICAIFPNPTAQGQVTYPVRQVTICAIFPKLFRAWRN